MLATFSWVLGICKLNERVLDGWLPLLVLGWVVVDGRADGGLPNAAFPFPALEKAVGAVAMVGGFHVGYVLEYP